MTRAFLSAVFIAVLAKGTFHCMLSFACGVVEVHWRIAGVVGLVAVYPAVIWVVSRFWMAAELRWGPSSRRGKICN